MFDNKLKAYGLRYLYCSNVVGLGFGRKEVKGKRQKDEALVYLVSKKIPEESLASEDILPRRIDEVETDVIEVGDIKLLDSRKSKMRPARPGTSMAHHRSTAGTFGALARSNETGEILILSNNHVLAKTTNGSDNRAAIYDPVLQPGPHDGGTQRDTVGYLYNYVPLHRELDVPTCSIARSVQGAGDVLCKALGSSYRFQVLKERKTENLVDAALAKPGSQNLVEAKIMELGMPQGTAVADMDMKLCKSGRSTGVTTGVIKVLEATVRVVIDEQSSILLGEQIVSTSMGQPGDSGALVLNEDMQAVGLLCAGSDSATISNSIQNVMYLLDIELLST